MALSCLGFVCGGLGWSEGSLLAVFGDLGRLLGGLGEVLGSFGTVLRRSWDGLEAALGRLECLKANMLIFHVCLVCCVVCSVV